MKFNVKNVSSQKRLRSRFSTLMKNLTPQFARQPNLLFHKQKSFWKTRRVKTASGAPLMPRPRRTFPRGIQSVAKTTGSLGSFINCAKPRLWVENSQQKQIILRNESGLFPYCDLRAMCSNLMTLVMMIIRQRKDIHLVLEILIQRPQCQRPQCQEFIQMTFLPWLIGVTKVLQRLLFYKKRTCYRFNMCHLYLHHIWWIKKWKMSYEIKDISI